MIHISALFQRGWRCSVRVYIIHTHTYRTELYLFFASCFSLLFLYILSPLWRAMASVVQKVAGGKAKQFSGIQREVFSVYRQIIREAYKKDSGARESIVAQARSEFRSKGDTIKRSDYQLIEHNIRRARKHVQLIQMPGFRGVSLWPRLVNSTTGAADGLAAVRK